MRRLFQLGLLCLLPMLAEGETLDRIVAIVDNQPILQSEWDDAVAFEAMMLTQPMSAITEELRRKTLNQMVDQRLLLDQMQTEVAASDEEAQRTLADLRSSLKLQSDKDWRHYLASYGLTEVDCMHQLTLHLAVLRFADFRLRANVKVDRSEIEAYYREHLVPEVEKRGATPDPLETLAPKIERLLTEQKISDMLSTWLHNLRDQGTVRFLIDDPQPAAPAQRPHSATVAKGQ
jgi:peptidyl-prolyl cis-trans isomerase SurA